MYECFKSSAVGCSLINSWKGFPEDTEFWVTKMLLRHLFLLQRCISSVFSCVTANLPHLDGDHKLGLLPQKHTSWKVSRCEIKNLIFQEHQMLKNILPRLEVCFKMVLKGKRWGGPGGTWGLAGPEPWMVGLMSSASCEAEIKWPKVPRTLTSKRMRINFVKIFRHLSWPKQRQSSVY